MRKSAAVPLIVTALLAPEVLAACGSDEPKTVDEQAVCVDRKDPNNPDDDVRVDDDRCGDDHDHVYHNGGGSDPLLWYWIGTMNGTRYPAVGTTINHFPAGTYVAPRSGSVAYGGVPRGGGAVPRGGFGGGARAAGGAKAGG